MRGTSGQLLLNMDIGEIQVLIKAYACTAYYLDTRGRAEQLLRSWCLGYQLNSGILLYLNLCEHKVEIVIDRGIQQATLQQV